MVSRAGRGMRAAEAGKEGVEGGEETHERYDTQRKGFWLKTSLSRNRFRKSHDIWLRLGSGRRLDAGCWGRDGDGRGRDGDGETACSCSCPCYAPELIGCGQRACFRWCRIRQAREAVAAWLAGGTLGFSRDADAFEGGLSRIVFRATTGTARSTRTHFVQFDPTASDSCPTNRLLRFGTPVSELAPSIRPAESE